MGGGPRSRLGQSRASTTKRRGAARGGERGGEVCARPRSGEYATTAAEMEENQTSESVAVLPDMSEGLTSETEEVDGMTTNEHEHEHKHEATGSVASVTGVTTGVQGVGVPVSLPVGSIIGVANSTNGTTFNVITSDQLQVLAFFFVTSTCSLQTLHPPPPPPPPRRPLVFYALFCLLFIYVFVSLFIDRREKNFVYIL